MKASLLLHKGKPQVSHIEEPVALVNIFLKKHWEAQSREGQQHTYAQD